VTGSQQQPEGSGKLAGRSLLVPLAAGALGGSVVVGIVIGNPLVGLVGGTVLALVITGAAWIIGRATRR
jgi:hypothetical protein